MATELSSDDIADRVNKLAFKSAMDLVFAANRMANDDGVPVAIAASITLDAGLMAAASFIRTAVLAGEIELAVPVERLLVLRMIELLTLPDRVHPRRPDGSFDPDGRAVH